MPYLLEPYDNALQEILDRGIKKADRTGVGTIGVAGLQRSYKLDTDYFPIVTGRKMFPKSVWAELIWFLSGSTQNKDLEALGAKFWGKWCDESNPNYAALRKANNYEPGDFGPIYGWQLRNFGGDYRGYRTSEHLKARIEREGSMKWTTTCANGDIIPHEIDLEDIEKSLEEQEGFDQLAYMIDILKNDPFGSNGRRCLFNLWNPNDLDEMALPPCHYTYQAIADGDGGLTGIMTQRSCDFPVGVPANIQFYSALTIMLAQQAGMKPREFIHNTNDSHIYLSQIEHVKEYLSRPKPDSPKVSIRRANDIYSYRVDDFTVTDYNPLAKIEMPVAV